MIGSAITYTFLFISLYFEIFLLVSFLERGRAIRGASAVRTLARFPKVSIIVPCFNEEKTVQSTIESLLNLSYPKDKFEVIVVDDGSRDGTLAAARKFEVDPRVRVFHKENGGKHSAMNFALAHTDAELIGCLDADSVVAPDALLRIIPVFENENVSAVTPGIHTKKPTNLLQHMQEVEYRLSIFNRFMLAFLGSAFITPGPFSIFRASIVRSLGGWRYGHSTEDMEMALRMQEAGYLIGNAPMATVYTSTPLRVKQLFRQRVRWTYGFLRNAIDYRRMIGNKEYGNLGLFIMPTAILSIGVGIYFFIRLAYETGKETGHEIWKIMLTGLLPHPSFSLFYLNTSAMWFLVWIAVVLILLLISIGSFMGTGKMRPPIGTPLFILFYSFLVPLWLSAAVVRAVFKTGVRWR